MKSKAQLFILVASLILVFDLLGCIASRLLHFSYTYLQMGSSALYTLSGYLGFRYRRELVGGLQAGLIAGLTDSTAGWALSAAILSQLGSPEPRPTIFLISIVVPLVTLVGGLCGLAGAAVAKGISLMEKDPGAVQ